ncbi:MAG: DUF3365 domain-containing protein [Haliscomenobacter sp.]|uniref:Tll0287-like domain-containing protein n=1 Tax=Haliscomenobacter sp. TaxID=2717303 RepID=UPI0029A65A4B|nr:DUF3365 domain-containing protein [Haliscomenobacter sp.]MDX2067161.1 DUF3365 domain-containing protein [Haliscomenobacter sp.]
MAIAHKFKFWVLAGSTFLLLLGACTTTQKTVEFSEKEQKDYLQKGQMVAQQSFAALSGRLMAAIEQGGIPHAVKYCNAAALPLIDSLSNVHQANIRRTSLKVRNRQDVAQGWEKEVLEAYQGLLAEGKKPAPVVKKLDPKRVAFAAPIFMAQPCLKCHGKLGETLNEQHYAAIKQLYPQDQAIGYVDGDWRGMWSITFFTK